MPPYMTSTVDAIRAMVGATCPELTEIWESKNASQQPYDIVTLPMAALRVSSVPSDEWGATNQCYLFTVEIFYLDKWNGQNDVILTRLELLRDAFWRGTLAVGQVIDVPEIDDSSDLEINQILAMKRNEHTAGRLTVQILVGELY